MSEPSMYDKFSQNYDRFVNWDSRLPSEIPFLLSKLSSSKSNQNQWILDAACGTGYHAIALANHGLNCVGVDNSIGMIKMAKENALYQNIDVTFRQAGFGDLEATFEGYRFDGLLCLGNSLPHVLSDKSLENTLRDFHSVLKDKGVLIIQNRNFDKVLAEMSRWMPPQTYREQDNTWIFSRFYDFVGDDQIIFNIQIFTSLDSEDFTQEIISTPLKPIKRESLTKMLLETGFIDLQHFGNLEGSEFNIDTSPNLVVVARAG
ncbi:MAG: class I SAM-dependent methyltransferase [Chloroflexota bacterium]|nr:class I SAM-dependent methyltransferase [Chloroflexota bacterium]